MSRTLPISPSYRNPVFQAIVLQLLILYLSGLILDGGAIGRICGVALVAFWGGVAVMIWRHPQSPTPTDIAFVRIGYLPILVLAYFLVRIIWHWRGMENQLPL